MTDRNLHKTILALAALAALAFPIRAQASPGSLDRSFGTSGFAFATIPNATSDHAGGVIVQRNGRIIAAVDSNAGSTLGSPLRRRAVLLAYRPGGSPDTSFGPGRNGRVVLRLGDIDDTRARAIAIARDPLSDRFYVLAAVQTRRDIRDCVKRALLDCYDLRQRHMIIKLRPDGSPDRSFGRDGTAGVPAGRELLRGRIGADIVTPLRTPSAFAVQPDGRVIIADAAPNSRASRLQRLRADGSALDPAFGTAGQAGTRLFVHGLLVEPSGRILAAGVSDRDAVLARFAASGRPDATFASGGHVRQRFHEGDDNSLSLATAESLARLPNGQYLTGGWLRTRDIFQEHLLALRFTAAGAPDTAFNSRGFQHIDFTDLTPDARASARAGDMVIGLGGRIVVAGSVDLNPDRRGDPRRHAHLALGVFNLDGSVSTAYGNQGRIITDVPNSDDETITDLAVEPDGDVVALAQATRYLADATARPHVVLTRYKAR